MANPEILNIADIYRELNKLKRLGGGETQTDAPITPTTPPSTQPQAANQLRNGSYAHSVGSWANSATADDRRYECAYWFSHPTTANHPMHIWDTDDMATVAKTVTAANVTSSGGSINLAIATHGFLTGDVGQFTTDNTLPANISAATDYYLIAVDANNLAVATSVANANAGTKIAYSTAGVGTHTFTPKNFTLKSDDHAAYSSSQCNWTRSDTPAGCARFNDYTLDAPLVQPTAEPGYTMFAVFNIARLSQYVYAPTTARLTCGLYARQNSVWNYLYGAFEVTATVSGTVVTATSRDYVVHVRTSRGFTVQTSAETVASAPADTDFSSGARVVLSWLRPLQYGVLGYDIYRYTTKTFTNADVDTGADTMAITAHTYATGDAVRLTSAGTLPTGLALATTYYVIKVNANSIKLATSAANATAGTAIDITGTTGAAGVTHTVHAYKLLDRVDTGATSYIDNNSYREDVVTAYPAADFTQLTAYTTSLDGVVANLAVDGVDTTWDTLPFAVRIPANYNHSLTDFTRNQWVRWRLTGLNGGATPRFDVRVTDGNWSEGGTSITSASAQFNAGMVGMTCTISTTKGTPIQTHTFTIDAFTSATEIQTAVGDEPAFRSNSNNGEVVIEGGSDVNKLAVDLAHLSFGENAIFGFHPDDLSPDRGQPPVAANGSNQGGTTIYPPSPGDGQPTCPWENEDITVTDGAGSIFTKKAKDLKRGDYTMFGSQIGEILNIKYHVQDVWRIATSNGFTAHTSYTHKYLTYPGDRTGTHLSQLTVGSDILTQIDGRDEMATLVTRELFQKDAVTVELNIGHCHQYLAGTGPVRKWGGIGSENRKPDTTIILE